jgi:hypothetical protein
MDPDALLVQIIGEALARPEDALATDVLDLIEWLARGGFPPRWEREADTDTTHKESA